MKIRNVVIMIREACSIMSANKDALTMINPGIGKLLSKVDSRYTLVVVVAKRARQLNEGSSKLVDCDSEKAVTVAVDEVSEDKITYIRTKSGIK